MKILPTVLILTILASACLGATVSVNPRGNGQGTVGTDAFRWGQGWFNLIGMGDNTNLQMTAISTNITGASTDAEFPTAAAVWLFANSFTGTVSETDITNWNKAWAWVDAYSNTFGTAATKDFVRSATVPGDDTQLPDWYTVQTYVDANTGTNVVTVADRANWNAAWASYTNFWRGDANNMYAGEEWDVADLYNANRWAWSIYSSTGTIYTYDYGTNGTQIPHWTDITNFVSAYGASDIVTDNDRNNWNSAYIWTTNKGVRYTNWDIGYTWVNAHSNSVQSMESKSSGWDNNYTWYLAHYVNLNAIETWYTTTKGDAADRTMGTSYLGSGQPDFGNSEMMDFADVRAYVSVFSSTGVVTDAERTNWDNTYDQVFNAAINHEDWDAIYTWGSTRTNGLEYVLSRTSVWDNATAPDLETVMNEGHFTSQQTMTYSNDFTITPYTTANPAGESDLILEAGSETTTTGAKLKLTGSDHATGSNCYVEVHLNSRGGNTPKVMIFDDNDADRVITINFNGDTAQIYSQSDMKIYANDTSTSYIEIDNVSPNVTLYSVNQIQSIAEGENRVVSFTNVVLNPASKLHFDLPSGYDVYWDGPSVDLDEVGLQNGRLDCTTTGKQMDVTLPTSDPGVANRLWSSNNIVIWTGP